MRKGAEVLVGVCAGVRKDEQVVIVTDRHRLPIAEAVAAAAQDVEGVLTLRLGQSNDAGRRSLR